MAASNSGKVQCMKCHKTKNRNFSCEGCSKIYCHECLSIHLQDLSKQLNEIEIERDQFRQTLNDQVKNPEKHALLEKITRWEKESKQKIEATAQECRQRLLQETNKHFGHLESELSRLTKEIKELRAENDFHEKHLEHFQKELTQLKEALDKPANISVKEESGIFIKKISVVAVTPRKCYYLYRIHDERVNL